MYMFREDINIDINQTKTQKIIGVSQTSLSLIINRKVACRKVVAYAITKYLNKNSEIEDYFVEFKGKE